MGSMNGYRSRVNDREHIPKLSACGCHHLAAGQLDRPMIGFTAEQVDSNQVSHVLRPRVFGHFRRCASLDEVSVLHDNQAIRECDRFERVVGYDQPNAFE
jgi:hypothetical protein